MDEPLRKVELLCSIVLQDNQDYFCMFFAKLEYNKWDMDG